MLVVTLTNQDNKKLFKHLEQGFKCSFSWNRYIAKQSTQNKKNESNYLINPYFQKNNKLFALGLEVLQVNHLFLLINYLKL